MHCKRSGQETLDRLKEVREEKELEALNVSVLGRNGALTEILRTMGKLDKEQRAKLGQASNAVKKELEEAIGARREKIAELMLERRFEKEALDVTEPGKRKLPGRASASDDQNLPRDPGCAHRHGLYHLWRP